MTSAARPPGATPVGRGLLPLGQPKGLAMGGTGLAVPPALREGGR